NTTEREQHLHGILARYLEATEAGTAPDRSEWLARHAEFAPQLNEVFAAPDRIGRLAPASLPPRTGRPFGDFQLPGKLGQGGMGVVYKGRQKSLNRTVALKMIRAGQLATEADAQRFRNEAEAAAHLDHPRIVPIYEVGEHDGQPYYSMKLVEGGSLAD